MKNKLKGFVLIVIIITISFMIPSFMDSAYYTKAADEAEWSVNDTLNDDTFTILEIVPYEGMGEIGYLVGGEEPVEEARMSISNAASELSHLGQAISVYPSYEESPMPSSGTVDPGWSRAWTEVPTDGYYDYVGSIWNGATYYRRSNQTVYERVADGAGTHIVTATLSNGTQLVNTYQNVTDPINRKNVNAYFVFGNPAGVPLFNANTGYIPYSVTEIPDRTGDYDYDYETMQFVLNKGNGKYDVLFVYTTNTTNVYHMTMDYEIVEDKSGDYSVIPSNIIYTYSVAEAGKGNYVSVTRDQFIHYTDSSLSFWEMLSCSYTLVSAEFPEGMENYQEDASGNIWVRGVGETYQPYQYFYNVELINNEWFKRYSLGIPSTLVEDTPVEVVTLTPEQLNANQSLIDQADLFYINANYNHNPNYIRLYETYNQDGINLPSNQKYASATATTKQNNLNFAIHDLSWSSVDHIFRRVAGIGCLKAGIIFDGTFYTNAIQGIGPYSSYMKQIVNQIPNHNGSRNATSVNMAKLYIMIYQRNRVDFYNSFINSNNANARLITQVDVASGVNRSLTTGRFIRPDRNNNYSQNEILYWNGNTFLGWGLNTSGAMVNFPQAQFVTQGIFNYNTLQNPTDILYNMLALGGNNVTNASNDKGIFDRNFVINPLSTNIPTDVQAEVINHLSTVYGTPITANQITVAGLVNYILNNGNGYGNTGGVSYPAGNHVEGVVTGITEDIVTAVEDGTDGSNTRNFKRVLNIQPTASFADGETAIRTILAGQEVQIVNMTSVQFNGNIEDINTRYDMIYMGSSAQRFNLNNNETNFNDNNLDRAIYFALGDEIDTRIDNVNATNRFRGNDLTEQKVRELNSFLSAGYPVVLDSVLYQTNATYIRSGTNIASFISQAKGRQNCLNYAEYTSNQNSFLSKLNSGLSVVRPKLKLVETPVKEAGLNYGYVDPATNLFTIKFALTPKGVLPSAYTFNAYLYLDKNGDGIFDPSEELEVISSDGSSWLGIRESFNRTNTYQYDMSDLNGVYQWKILVKRLDNAGNEIHDIRGSLTGYVANTIEKDLHILHITDNSSTYSLQTMVDDTSKLINQLTRNLKDYNLFFETLTVQQFQAKYAEVPYTSATAATSNKLSKYHLLILDNPTSPIKMGNNNDNGATLNIKEEIANRNLAVVFTKNALGVGNQDLYFGGGLNSFLASNAYTYNTLNQNARYYNIFGYKYIYQLFSYRNMVGDYGNDLTVDNAYRTIYTTKTNEGSITRYPYQLKDAVQIADNAYSNEVTVDLDLTKTNRMIGWYSLSDSRSPVVRNVFGLGGNTGDLFLGTYSSSPNDVKNNYYLFSNGLCFYSGIHLATADQTGNDEEMKLFVNTLIAAYKASNRVVSSPPVIEYIHPKLIKDPVTYIESITITPEDLTGEEFILTFEISESSSPMELGINLVGDTGLTGNWNQTVYEADLAGNLGNSITVNNTDVTNRIYAVKIPKSQLIGTNVLTVSAENNEGNAVDAKVTLIFVQPPVVTIEDPIPASNDTSQYIYVDIDYTEGFSEEATMNNTPQTRILFKVTAMSSTVDLEITSAAGVLNPADFSVHAVNADGSVSSVEQSLVDAPIGTYALDLSMSLLINKNSREFTIEATDLYGLSGETTFILLRRNLFPLD